MKKLFLVLVAMVVLGAVVVEAAEIQVLRGDSLWKITEACGRDGARWPEVQAVNPQLPAPEREGEWIVVWVYPGQVLTLPQGWGTDNLDASYLEIVETSVPLWERLRRYLAEAWEWAVCHPWVWGLLGLLGLLGLMGRRAEAPVQPAPMVVNNYHHAPEPAGLIATPSQVFAEGPAGQVVRQYHFR